MRENRIVSLLAELRDHFMCVDRDLRFRSKILKGKHSCYMLCVIQRYVGVTCKHLYAPNMKSWRSINRVVRWVKMYGEPIQCNCSNTVKICTALKVPAPTVISSDNREWISLTSLLCPREPNPQFQSLSWDLDLWRKGRFGVTVMTK